MSPKQRRRPNTSLSSSPSGAGQRMLYTGPDYIRDYRTKRYDFTGYIGEVMPSRDNTGDANYLWRPAPGTPAPLNKDLYVGGIGWGVSEFRYLNRREMSSNYQIKLGEFHQACEDNTTHRFQNPWSPTPCVFNKQGFGARAKQAWTQGTYDCFNKSNTNSTTELDEYSIPSKASHF